MPFKPEQGIKSNRESPHTTTSNETFNAQATESSFRRSSLKPTTFEIRGDITSPGTYTCLDGMTLINAIALAGGLSSEAAFDTIVVIRGGKHLYASDLTTDILPKDIISILPISTSGGCRPN